MGGPRWKVLIAHPETGDGIQLVAGIVFSSW
jgi:hypothetical protein